MKVSSLITHISNPAPTPGGGSVSALSGALSASLASMVSNLTHNTKGFEKYRKYHNMKSQKCQKYLSELLKLVDDDANSFNEVINAMRMSKKTAKENKD